MYKNILLPIAPDHGGTFSKAYEVARRVSHNDARITALTVIEAVPGFAKLYLPKDHQEEARAGILEALQSESDAAENVDVDVVSGHSGQTILDYANTNDVDCIVITSHRPGLSDFFLGSTAARVVRYFKGAVHVLR